MAIPVDELKPVRHPQYLNVYVEEDVHIELWIRDQTRQFAGDYCEAGIYGDKKYFIKKEKGKQPLYLFWSTYLGFDGGWYLGQELGGASLAWAMIDGDLPPEEGWLIRGSVPGYHVDTSMKVQPETTMLHEVHVVENCLCAPIRGLKSCATGAEGACIAMMSGSTDDVAQLRKHPGCTSCMTGMLGEMSCSVPLSYAFEHSIDAWYRAWFVDGFCYTASYERAITGTENDIYSLDKKRHKAYNHWLYHGYNSRIGEETAYRESFKESLKDLLSINVHVRKYTSNYRDHPNAYRIANETACHVPLCEALGDLCPSRKGSRAEKSDKSGFMGKLGMAACCVCGNKQKEKPAIKSSQLAVEEPRPAIKSREVTVEPKPATKSSQLTVEESEPAIDVRLLKVQEVKPTAKVIVVQNPSYKEDVSCFCCGKPKSKPKSKEVKPAVKSREVPAVATSQVDDDPRFWPLKEPRKIATPEKPVDTSEQTDVQRRLLMADKIMAEIQTLKLKTEKPITTKQIDNDEHVRRIKQEVGAHARELQGVIVDLMEEIKQLKETGVDNEKEQKEKLDELRSMAGGHLDSCQALERRCEALEKSEVLGKSLLKQKAIENEVLQKELGIAARRIDELEAQENTKKVTEGMQRDLITEANEGQAKRVAALEAELRVLKETEAVQKVNLGKLDRLAGTYSQRNAELEESEKVRALKMKESDAAVLEANNKLQDLDALHKQRTADNERLQAEVEYLKDQAAAAEAANKDPKDVVLKSQYVQLESFIVQQSGENQQLKSELGMLKQKVEQQYEEKYTAEMQYQQKDGLLKELEARAKRVPELEDEIRQMRESEARNTSAIQASVELQKAKVEELERDASAAEAMRKTKEAELEKIIDAYKERCSELEGAGSMLKQSEASVLQKTRDLEVSLQEKTGEIQMVRSESGMLQQQIEERTALEAEYQTRDALLLARASELEASLQQQVGQNSSLRAEVEMLQKKLAEGKSMTQTEIQQREAMLKACQPQDQSSQVEELEYQIRCIRETEANNMKAFQLAQAEHEKRCEELEKSRQRGQELEQHHRQRCQDLERQHASKCQEMEQQHTQRSKELEEQVFQARQKVSMQEVRVEEVEALYALKIQELEGAYGQQIQDRDMQVTTVQQTRQGLEQQLLDVQQKAFDEQSLAAQQMASMQEELQKLQKQLFEGQQLRQDLEQQLVSAEQQGFERSVVSARQNASEHEALEKQVLAMQKTRRELEQQLMAAEQKTTLQEQQLLVQEQQLLVAQQNAGAQQKAQDIEEHYVRKLQELEASYAQQLQLVAGQADEAQTLKQQLQVMALQTEADKGRLTQYEQEFMAVEQEREAFKGETTAQRQRIESLTSQLQQEHGELEAMKQQTENQTNNVQASIDAMREGLEASHNRQLQEVQATHVVQIEQLQTVIAEGNQLSAALEGKLLNIEQSNQAKQGEEIRISQLQADSELLAGELSSARSTIQELQQVAAQQEEEMREREYAYEKRQVEFEGELSTLRQQVLLSSRPDDDFARATRELRELSSAMENERALYSAQVEELQGALMRSTEEANVLREELAQVQSGQSLSVPASTPTVVYSQQPGLTIETASRTVPAVPASPPKYAVETVQSAKYVVEGQARQYVVEGPPVQRLSSGQGTVSNQEVGGSYLVNQESTSLPTSAPILTSHLAAQRSVQLPVHGVSQGSVQLPVQGISQGSVQLPVQSSGLVQKRVINASPMQTREERIPITSPIGQTRVDRYSIPTTGSITRPLAESRVMYVTETGRSGYVADPGLGMSIESRPGT